MFTPCQYPAHFEDYHPRELRKRAAWDVFHAPGATLDEQVDALTEVLRAQFDRSLERAHDEKRLEQHPELDVYIRMRDLSVAKYGAQLVARMRALFGPPIVGPIVVGSSYFTRDSARQVAAMAKVASKAARS